jgi:hypothetical protein|tara:strand:- start:517 stop:762 length:246 start_codon:yes stop_codon:yes gene_type:complete
MIKYKNHTFADMEIDGNTIYHIPRVKFVKHIRHSLGTTMAQIQASDNLRVEYNKNTAIIDVQVLTENNRWKDWLYDNQVIV